MNITDKEVLKELKRVRSGELEDSVFDYPENDRDGRSDMQVLTDELSWILSNFKEDGHVLVPRILMPHSSKTIPTSIS